MSIPDSLNKWTLSNYQDFRKDEYCGICLGKGEDESKIVYHSFGNQSSKERHEFHRNCINRWIETSSSDKCPTCNKVIKFRPGVGVITVKKKKLQDVEEHLTTIGGVLGGFFLICILPAGVGAEDMTASVQAAAVLTAGVAAAAFLGVIGIKAMRFFELG